MTDQAKTKPIQLSKDEMRKRAASQAAQQRAEQAKTAKQAEAELQRGIELAPPQEATFRVRVTRRGAGRISTGHHVSGVGEVHFVKDEEFDCTESQFAALAIGPDPKNERDWVEKV